MCEWWDSCLRAIAGTGAVPCLHQRECKIYIQREAALVKSSREPNLPQRTSITVERTARAKLVTFALDSIVLPPTPPNTPAFRAIVPTRPPTPPDSEVVWVTGPSSSERWCPLGQCHDHVHSHEVWQEEAADDNFVIISTPKIVVTPPQGETHDAILESAEENGANATSKANAPESTFNPDDLYNPLPLAELKGDTIGFGRFRNYSGASLKYLRERIDRDTRGPYGDNYFPTLGLGPHPLHSQYEERRRVLLASRDTDEEVEPPLSFYDTLTNPAVRLAWRMRAHLSSTVADDGRVVSIGFDPSTPTLPYRRTRMLPLAQPCGEDAVMAGPQAQSTSTFKSHTSQSLVSGPSDDEYIPWADRFVQSVIGKEAANVGANSSYNNPWSLDSDLPATEGSLRRSPAYRDLRALSSMMSPSKGFAPRKHSQILELVDADEAEDALEFEDDEKPDLPQPVKTPKPKKNVRFLTTCESVPGDHKEMVESETPIEDVGQQSHSIHDSLDVKQDDTAISRSVQQLKAQSCPPSGAMCRIMDKRGLRRFAAKPGEAADRLGRAHHRAPRESVKEIAIDDDDISSYEDDDAFTHSAQAVAEDSDVDFFPGLTADELRLFESDEDWVAYFKGNNDSLDSGDEFDSESADDSDEAAATADCMIGSTLPIPSLLTSLTSTAPGSMASTINHFPTDASVSSLSASVNSARSFDQSVNNNRKDEKVDKQNKTDAEDCPFKEETDHISKGESTIEQCLHKSI